MTGGREGARRQGRAPLRQRSRRRWAITGGIAACWVVLEVVTGSLVSATLLLVVIVGLTAVSVGGLRALGITRDHPFLQRMSSRPWRDGQDVLKVAMRHMSDVFVVTPSGSLLAPNVVELQLNPDDLDALCERMEVGVISASMTEVYEEQVASYGARFAGPAQAEVYVIADESVPPGRYHLRQGDPVGAEGRFEVPDWFERAEGPELPEVQYPDDAPELAYAAPRPAAASQSAQQAAPPQSAQQAAPPQSAQQAAPPQAASRRAYAWPERHAWHDPDQGPTVAGGMATIMEHSVDPVPVLRLVTGSAVAETRMSGARAGRGYVELMLPDVLTVSREHAKFTFSDGRWRITNQGRNGLSVNGAPVAGEQSRPLSDGDEIRWGSRPDALLSRVEIS